MATNYVQPGNTIEFAHSSSVESGEAIYSGNVVLVALGAFDADESGSYAIDGVFTLPKASAAGAMSVGAQAFIDTGEITDVVGNYAGVVTKAAGASDEAIEVRINFGSFGENNA